MVVGSSMGMQLFGCTDICVGEPPATCIDNDGVWKFELFGTSVDKASEGDKSCEKMQSIQFHTPSWRNVVEVCVESQGSFSGFLFGSIDACSLHIHQESSRCN